MQGTCTVDTLFKKHFQVLICILKWETLFETYKSPGKLHKDAFKSYFEQKLSCVQGFENSSADASVGTVDFLQILLKLTKTKLIQS